ncbi:DUF2927 domain-containing protein [Alloyangia pacifica]|uniref:DUF2927 domain-containing protein n=1 Tax=Alloyangia pacifica TaxID=311180 RepID=A0A1I6S0Q8_9RHOB|nr:DUF2927 domain-containing protein [Alloyangia pacifica]SDG68350.1 Protein of unknown function [Alloyangia pacifica]SFS70527.1 Protein of unknown function [Alloyangia pacifica]
MRSWGRLVLGILVCAGLAACDSSALAPRSTGVLPQSRPSGLRPPEPAKNTVPRQSLASYDLGVYYARVQADLLSQGLLRTDGGGPDTPITDTMLVRNFERIALAEEYARGEGLKPSRGELGRVKKWEKPVRVAVEFGAHVPENQRVTDSNMLGSYVGRLARITGHPISMSTGRPNFHVLFMSEDDKATIAPRIKQLVPDVNPTALAVFDNLPREIHCLVIAFSEEPGGYAYGQAIAVIRSEHPDLLRRSCVHEEVAQGLGLGNDSPQARPSIFNDDDEFALLTSMDEMLLKILYDPQLKPGMDDAAARPIVAGLAAQMTGGLGPS